MIYFSYFGNPKIPKGIRQISISRYSPDWWSGAEYKKLAPTSPMLKMSQKQYDIHFARILAELDQKQVYDELMVMTGGMDFCLLCYEKPPKFCHRFTVMMWFKQAGFDVKECYFKGAEKLRSPVPNGNDQPSQNSLF